MKKVQNYLAMCAIVKDEERFIEEWVAFHFAAGVDFILLVDNGNSRYLSRQLAGYISEGRLEIRAYPQRAKAQREAYNRALYYMRKFTWVGFFDVDEFVFPVQSDSLPEALDEFEAFPGVAANWVTFGTNGHRNSPPGWVIENFTDRGKLDFVVPLEHLRVSNREPKIRGDGDEYLPMNSHVKCFVRPSETLHFRTAHNFKFKKGRPAVNENFREVWGPFSPEISIEKLRVNHYWSKSLQDLNEKLSKGRVSQNSRRHLSGYMREAAISRALAASGVTDTSAHKFLNRAKEIEQENLARRVSVRAKTVFRLRFPPHKWVQDLYRKASTQIRSLTNSAFERIGLLSGSQTTI